MKKSTFPYQKINFVLSIIGFVGSLGFYYTILKKVYSDEKSKQELQIELLQKEISSLKVQLKSKKP